MESVKNFFYGCVLIGLGIGIFVGIMWGLIWGWQYFKVFTATQSGKAEFARAEQDRQIRVVEANASNEAATLQAQARVKQASAEAEAEIVRAKGVAEANRIIADSLRGNEAYLRYLWIDKLSDNQNVIYVPTEAGLPVLEAGKRQ